MQGFSDWTMQRFMYKEANVKHFNNETSETTLQKAIKKIKESHDSPFSHEWILNRLIANDLKDSENETALDKTINDLNNIIEELSIYKK
jgi:hypothetical protein